MPILQIRYELVGEHTDEQESQLAIIRAGHIKAIFGLLEIVDVEKHYVRGESIEPHINLNHALNGVGELGSALADSLFGHIDELQTQINNATTLLLPEGEEAQ